MNLTKNFTLSEMVRSTTASQRKIDNTPSAEVISNLIFLCREVLQPVRDMTGRPLRVNSGYRSEALNRAVGGSKTSDHRFGLAADVT